MPYEYPYLSLSCATFPLLPLLLQFYRLTFRPLLRIFHTVLPCLWTPPHDIVMARLLLRPRLVPLPSLITARSVGCCPSPGRRRRDLSTCNVSPSPLLSVSQNTALSSSLATIRCTVCICHSLTVLAPLLYFPIIYLPEASLTPTGLSSAHNRGLEPKLF